MTNIIQKIDPINPQVLDAAQAHLDNLTKPPGSLGRLEELAHRYAGIKNTDSPILRNKAIYVFAGDHGVTQEGISAYPSEVTQQMVINFLNGGAAINVLAAHIGAQVKVIDMGVDCEFGNLPELINKKVAKGTRNMVCENTMTREQAEEAIQAGLELAYQGIQNDIDVFGTGDMGIGNTTPSTAILSLYGSYSIELITGTGTGIDEICRQKKIQTIKKALAFHSPNPKDPIDVLSKVGGFEIAGITGLILGAAAQRSAIIIDGLISGAAAVLACKMNPVIKEYIFISHRSQEPAHQITFDQLDQHPLLDLNMRLGEGTGAALAISLLEASVKLYSQMATFKSAGISGKTESES